MKKLILFILIVLISNQLLAANADMQLDIEITDTTNLTRGSVIPFKLTVTNNGPEDSDSLAVIYNDNTLNNGFSVLSDIPFIVDDSIEQNCELFGLTTNDIVPNTEPFSLDFYFVRMPDLPANSSVSCYILAEILIDKPTKVNFNAVVRQGFDNDEDLSNNLKSVIFILKPQIIPMFSKLSIFVLIILFLIFSFKNFHNNLGISKI